ncbi:MAG: hypothetical protein ACLVG6_00275 [Dorea formicigenerans]
MFSGVLVRLGKQLGIPTPYNALALDTSSRHLKKKMTAGLIINNPGRK